MKKKMITILIICLSIFTIFHFSIIALSTGPLNPVSMKQQNFFHSYMHPLLFQQWNLFAPEPVSHTDRIAIKVMNNQGDESEWFDIGRPLLDKNQNNSISPYNRAARIPTGLVQNLFEEEEIIAKFKEKSEDDSDKFLDKNEEKVRHENHIDQLYRFSFSMAQLIEHPNNIEKVKVRVINDTPVPYSKRNDQNYKTEELFVEYDWREFRGEFKEVVTIK
ncbi:MULTISPECIES: DUF5819 family protein [Cytobacillus]|uniref:DNA-directed RNA polymerase subunit beta n=1 Tax=Cytobacillus stercorigallinarum TaxID=2762240 RepID=A0ABR8QU34_9BACI|nr:DUF5819 family protein [Cytobacillus stercorigallinarum]MBD7938937.1 hypothetical protein [Cytobacillus stercorigallinarum]